MSRYDDLPRMREARFAAQKTFVEKPPAAVTKPVTKPNSVTKPADVTKPNKGGRPLQGDKPMTAAERMRRYRARHREAQGRDFLPVKSQTCAGRPKNNGVLEE
jgi:hypothetical protein